MSIGKDDSHDEMTAEELEAAYSDSLLPEADKNEIATQRMATDGGWTWDSDADCWVTEDGRQIDRYGDVR